MAVEVISGGARKSSDRVEATQSGFDANQGWCRVSGRFFSPVRDALWTPQWTESVVFPNGLRSSSQLGIVLSECEHSERHRGSAQGDECEAGKHLPEREATIEPVGELGRVPRRMLGAQMVIRAMQRAPNVAQDGVDPGELRLPGTCRPTSGRECLAKTPGVLRRAETPQGVRLTGLRGQPPATSTSSRPPSLAAPSSPAPSRVSTSTPSSTSRSGLAISRSIRAKPRSGHTHWAAMMTGFCSVGELSIPTESCSPLGIENFTFWAYGHTSRLGIGRVRLSVAVDLHEIDLDFAVSRRYSS